MESSITRHRAPTTGSRHPPLPTPELPSLPRKLDLHLEKENGEEDVELLAAAVLVGARFSATLLGSGEARERKECGRRRCGLGSKTERCTGRGGR